MSPISASADSNCAGTVLNAFGATAVPMRADASASCAGVRDVVPSRNAPNVT